MRSAARQAAAARYDEAKRVMEAYAVQVQTRRKRWLAATTDAANRFAGIELAEATLQHDAAKKRERAAWREWHRLTDG